jgi:hypothetical protein
MEKKAHVDCLQQRYNQLSAVQSVKRTVSAQVPGSRGFWLEQLTVGCLHSKGLINSVLCSKKGHSVLRLRCSGAQAPAWIGTVYNMDTQVLRLRCSGAQAPAWIGTVYKATPCVAIEMQWSAGSCMDRHWVVYNMDTACCD